MTKYKPIILFLLPLLLLPLLVVKVKQFKKETKTILKLSKE